MTESGPTPEPLDYEEMLAALLGLLGQDVTVEVQLRFQRQARPLATLAGVLRRGEALVPPPEMQAELGVPGGEWMLFQVDAGTFVLRRDDFKLGRRDGDLLAWQSGRARIIVGPPPPDAEVDEFRRRTGLDPDVS